MKNLNLLLAVIIASLTLISCDKDECNLPTPIDTYGYFYLKDVSAKQYIFRNGEFELYVDRNHHSVADLHLHKRHRYKYTFNFEFSYIHSDYDLIILRLPEMENQGLYLKFIETDAIGYEQ